MNELQIKNSQRTCRINLALFRKGTCLVLEKHLKLPTYSLGLHFISNSKMAEINEGFLNHHGPTDVITFDYRNDAGMNEEGEFALHGEIFICPAVAREYAKEFKTHLGEELCRYMIHGILHLQGFDDLAPAPKRIMKRHENRLVCLLAAELNLKQIVP